MEDPTELNQISEKYKIPLNSTFDEVVEKLKCKLNEYKFYLRASCKSKDKIVKEIFNKRNENYLKYLDEDIKDATIKIADIEDELSTLVEVGKPQKEKKDSNIEKCEEFLADLKRLLKIEKDVMNSVALLMNQYQGKTRKQIGKIWKESQTKSLFLENQINRIKKLQRDEAIGPAKSESQDSMDGKDHREIEILELKNRFMINAAILVGCRKAIGLMKDKNEALSCYRELYQKMYLYHQSLQSLVRLLPESSSFLQDKDLSCLSKSTEDQKDLIERMVAKGTTSCDSISTNMLCVSGSFNVRLKRCSDIMHDFPTDMISVALGSGFKATSSTIYKSAEQGKIRYLSFREQCQNVKCVIKVGKDPLFETSYNPITDDDWKDSVEISINRDKQVEVQIYTQVLKPKSEDNVWVLAAFNYLKLEDFLDGELHSFPLNLYPQGIMYLDVEFRNPVIGKKLKRRHRRFPRAWGRNVMRAFEMGISQALWNRLISYGHKMVMRKYSKMRTYGCVNDETDAATQMAEKFNHGAEFDEESMSVRDIQSELPPIAETKADIVPSSNVNEPLFPKANCVLTFDQFSCKAVLGKGKFGTVLLSQWNGNHQYLAIKALKKETICNDNEFESLRTEKHIMQIISLAKEIFLVNLLGCFQTKDHVIFAMDYAAGGDLFQYLIKETKFKQSVAVFYASCVVLGLEFLHSNKIAYRDLKLENLLIHQDGYIKMADFGLSKENMSYDTRTSTVCGTVDYLAPEMIIERSYTLAVDWWAFGVLIYVMLVGEFPFWGQNEAEIQDLIANNNPKYPRSLSFPASTLLKKLLRFPVDLRLGANEKDASDVKKDTFFKYINFDDLREKKIKPPFVPILTHAEDVSYFDEELTKERAILICSNKKRKGYGQLFADFDCNCGLTTQ